MAHHDAIGPEPAARRACTRAVRRRASGRRRGEQPRRRRFCADHDPLGIVRAQGERQRHATEWLPFRAHSLERCDGFDRAHRRPGDARDRPLFRPARRQGDPGGDRAGGIRVPRICALRVGHLRYPTAPGGRASRWRRPPDCCSRATTAPQPGATVRGRCSATTLSLPNCATTGAASTARRRSSPDSSTVACSSVPPRPRRNGTPSRRCSKPGTLARRGAARAPVGPLGRRPCERGTDRVRLLRRRADHHSRRAPVGQGDQRRKHRRGAARRHQLWLVPA